MSDPIKPTGPRPPTEVAPPSTESRETDDLRAGPVPGAEAPKAAPSRGVSQLVGELTAALAERRIASHEAVDALVDQALASPLAARLTDDGRRELERLLRALVDDDPHVSELVRRLDRG